MAPTRKPKSTITFAIWCTYIRHCHGIRFPWFCHGSSRIILLCLTVKCYIRHCPFVYLLQFLKRNCTSEQRLRIDHTPFSVARHSMSAASTNTGSNGEPLYLSAQLIDYLHMHYLSCLVTSWRNNVCRVTVPCASLVRIKHPSGVWRSSSTPWTTGTLC